jgi:hypothetical protein
MECFISFVEKEMQHFPIVHVVLIVHHCSLVVALLPIIPIGGFDLIVQSDLR